MELQLHPGPSEIDYRAKFETLRGITCDIQLVIDASFHWNFNPFIRYMYICERGCIYVIPITRI